MNKVYCSDCKKLSHKKLSWNGYSQYEYKDCCKWIHFDDPICLHNFEEMSNPSPTKKGFFSLVVGWNPEIKNKKLDCIDFEPNFWYSLKLVIKEKLNKLGL